MRRTLTQALLAVFCAILARGTFAAHMEGGGVMQIASRVSMWSGARTPTAKDYVQDGMLRLFDGIENSGFGVHRDGPWFDLITGKAATIGADSIWGDDHLSRTAKTNSAGNMAYLSVDAYNTMVRRFNTIEVVASFAETGYVYTEQSYRFAANEWNRHSYIWYQNGRVYLGHYSAKSISVPAGTKVSCCFTEELVNGEYVTTGAYLNGEPTDSGAWANYYNSQITIAIGGSNGSGRAMLGDIYAIRTYSRVLTASEIAANYAIDKERFGLT